MGPQNFESGTGPEVLGFDVRVGRRRDTVNAVDDTAVRATNEKNTHIVNVFEWRNSAVAFF